MASKRRKLKVGDWVRMNPPASDKPYKVYAVDGIAVKVRTSSYSWWHESDLQRIPTPRKTRRK